MLFNAALLDERVCRQFQRSVSGINTLTAYLEFQYVKCSTALKILFVGFHLEKLLLIAQKVAETTGKGKSEKKKQKGLRI